jgi:RHS repeat-associated protein
MGYGAADSTRQKFAGYERDNETGLDYAHARYYANAQGRFTSPDPLFGSIANPQTLNRYSYVTNNPVNLTDSTGMMIDASRDWESVAATLRMRDPKAVKKQFLGRQFGRGSGFRLASANLLRWGSSHECVSTG